MADHSRTFTATNTIIGGAIATVIAAFVIYLIGFNDDEPSTALTQAVETQTADAPLDPIGGGFDDSEAESTISTTQEPIEQAVLLIDLEPIIEDVDLFRESGVQGSG